MHSLHSIPEAQRKHPVSVNLPSSTPITSDIAGASIEASEDPNTACTTEHNPIIPSTEEVAKQEWTLIEVSASADQLSTMMCTFLYLNGSILDAQI
jgi:hypothetical protein